MVALPPPSSGAGLARNRGVSHARLRGCVGVRRPLTLAAACSPLPPSCTVCCSVDRQVAAASGQLLMFCDDDDLWLSQHVVAALREFHEDPGLGYVKTRVQTDASLAVHEDWAAALDASLVINLAGMCTTASCS